MTKKKIDEGLLEIIEKVYVDGLAKLCLSPMKTNYKNSKEALKAIQSYLQKTRLKQRKKWYDAGWEDCERQMKKEGYRKVDTVLTFSKDTSMVHFKEIKVKDGGNIIKKGTKIAVLED